MTKPISKEELGKGLLNGTYKGTRSQPASLSETLLWGLGGYTQILYIDNVLYRINYFNAQWYWSDELEFVRTLSNCFELFDKLADHGLLVDYYSSYKKDSHLVNHTCSLYDGKNYVYHSSSVTPLNCMISVNYKALTYIYETTELKMDKADTILYRGKLTSSL